MYAHVVNPGTNLARARETEIVQGEYTLIGWSKDKDFFFIKRDDFPMIHKKYKWVFSPTGYRISRTMSRYNTWSDNTAYVFEKIQWLDYVALNEVIRKYIVTYIQDRTNTELDALKEDVFSFITTNSKTRWRPQPWFSSWRSQPVRHSH